MFQPGDTIGIPWMLNTTHTGVVVGWWRDGRVAVIHNSKQSGHVVIDDLDGFAGGKQCSLIDRPPTLQLKRVTVNRALARVGESYDLLTFNCEHLTTYARTGNSESRQLQGLLLLTALAVTSVIVFSHGIGKT